MDEIGTLLQKAVGWEESRHPRGVHGRWIIGDRVRWHNFGRLLESGAGRVVGVSDDHKLVQVRTNSGQHRQFGAEHLRRRGPSASPQPAASVARPGRVHGDMVGQRVHNPRAGRVGRGTVEVDLGDRVKVRTDSGHYRTWKKDNVRAVVNPPGNVNPAPPRAATPPRAVGTRPATPHLPAEPKSMSDIWNVPATNDRATPDWLITGKLGPHRELGGSSTETAVSSIDGKKVLIKTMSRERMRHTIYPEGEPAREQAALIFADRLGVRAPRVAIRNDLPIKRKRPQGAGHGPNQPRGPAGRSGDAGMAQEWVQNAKNGAEHAGGMHTRPTVSRGDAERMAVLDAVIGNTDRHNKNFMIGGDDGKVYAIDHGLAFPSGRDAGQSVFVKAMAGQVIPSELLAALRRMQDDRRGLTTRMRDVGLDDMAISRTWDRIDLMTRTGRFPKLAQLGLSGRGFLFSWNVNIRP